MTPTLCLFGLLAALTATDDRDIVIADFEGPGYGGWIVQGEAFGNAPAQGTLPNQMQVSGIEGRGMANSFRGGDRATGTLTSPEFAINRKAISFLIGGGGWAGKTCMNLIVDGAIVRTATGPNTQPGGSERLERMNWDTSDLVGRTGRLEIVDAATEGWGHINIDQIVLTDRPSPGLVQTKSRKLTIDNRFLNLPMRYDSPLRRHSLAAEGMVVDEFEASIAEGAPEYWIAVDVSRLMGKTITLSGHRLPSDGAALDAVSISDAPTGTQALYDEQLRPQFHFSSRSGWLNDPNGLVYSRGEYHLYYQHNPFGWAWGNMHWGHAVSRDLVRWTELPIAITPRAFGDWAYSGSAVVDAANTSGWKNGDQDVIVAAYTSTARGECIAYSNDGGRTFIEPEVNPVVTHAKGEGRDPRLLWYGPRHGEGNQGHWVMAVYDEDRDAPDPDRRGIAFYTSPDLKTWTYRSRTGGFFECPDLFELAVDGGKVGRKWVLTAADSTYMLGSFDGEKFTPDEPRRKLPGNRSDRFYAAQTFSDSPDGRRIQIGWGRIDSPGMPFNQMMSFPCELALRTTDVGVRMFAWPVAEIEKLYGETWSVRKRELRPTSHLASDISGDCFDLSLRVDTKSARVVELNVKGMSVRFEVNSGSIACGNVSGTLSSPREHLDVRVLVDRTSVEVFANQGEVAILLAAAFSNDLIKVSAEGGVAVVEEFTVRRLKSAWVGNR